MISGTLVFASIIPYTIRTCQGKIVPNLTSWTLWSFIGLALLVTYRESGAIDNIWPAVFGFINPAIITSIAWWRRTVIEPLTRWEKMSAVGCLSAFTLWFVLRGNKEYAQYALYMTIIADLCAYVPTYLFVRVHPESDRPIPWIIFGFAYGLGAFAVTEHSFANYALPVYMCVGTLGASIPLIRHRLKKRLPISEWI